MAAPTVGVAITATDKTRAGIAAASKSLSGLVKKGATASAASTAAAERNATRATGVITKLTSATSRGVAQLGALGDAGTTANAGLRAAATGVGAMSSAMSGLAGRGGIVIEIMTGLAAAATKLGLNFADSAANIGRFAQTIGVSAQALQKFQGAAERMGIDKATAGGGLAAMSQTLNDAVYGRNAAAMSTLAYAGIKVRRKSNGDIDLPAMVPDIANAFARQKTDSGRRTIAANIGMPTALIPVFSQGGAALNASMTSAGKYAPMYSDAEIQRAYRYQSDKARVGQLTARRLNRAGVLAGDIADPVALAAIRRGEARVDGGGDAEFSHAAHTVKDAAVTFAGAVEKFADNIVNRLFGGGGGASAPSGHATAPSGHVVAPSGIIGSRFGMRMHPTLHRLMPHNGVDLRVPAGTGLRAPAGGRVHITRNALGGLQAFIDHGNGTVTGYAHLSHVNVPEGATVSAGQVFAMSGGVRGAPGSGDSTGPHLHWSVKRGGRFIDPLLSGLSLPTGAINNPGGIRARGGFASYPSGDNGLASVARQVLTDEMRGQDTLEKLIGGVRGADGKLHGGYAPASDGNDVPAYLRFLQGQTGLAPGAKLNPEDTMQVAKIVAGIVRQETNTRVDPIHVQVVIETRGQVEAARTTVTATHPHGPVAVHKSSVGKNVGPLGAG